MFMSQKYQIRGRPSFVVISWKLDLNKIENGTLGANLVPINKVTKFEE